jgi:hypothetical protein
MAIQDFTVGQVLTAAQMDSLQANDYNQTVSTKTANYTLVAADKGTRVVMNVSSASTITVDTSLFSAGDTVILQNIASDASTVTAGTATVTSAGPLAIPQYGSGTLYFTSASVAIYFPSAVTVAAPPASGLTYVGGDTLSGSSTAFTSVFSATYDNYRVFVGGLSIASGSGVTGMILGATTSGYESIIALQSAPGGYSGWFGSGSNANMRFANVFTTKSHIVFDLLSPNKAETTRMFFNAAQESDQIMQGSGAIYNTTAYTDFTIETSASTFNAGTVQIFGYANS